MVIKRGDRGAPRRPSGGEVVEAPALPARVVDTTGAGDSFDAGFLAAFLANEPLETLAADRHRRAARSRRSSLGGTEGQPTMDEVLAAIERGSAA